MASKRAPGKVETPEEIDAYLDGLARSGSEHAHQRAFFAWLALMQHRQVHPMARMAFAVPNGGERNIVVAQRMKTEGVKAGVPDIVYPVPLHGWHGMLIEMKIVGGNVSEAQQQWHIDLRTCGYCVCVCWSWRGARLAFEQYALNGRCSTEYA